MKKGQTSIEFLIIIVLIITYIVSVTYPMIKSAQSSVTDIRNLTQTDNECMKIMQGINRLNNFSNGSKETIILRIPENGKIYCYNDGNIGFSVKINENKNNPETKNCPNDICDKNYFVNPDLKCLKNELTQNQTIILQKIDNNIIIN
ncbi:MAG TPA: hypothetical protein PKK60_01100 [archaeon]|nr:hypothetical protein [archaeon]